MHDILRVARFAEAFQCIGQPDAPAALLLNQISILIQYTEIRALFFRIYLGDSALPYSIKNHAPLSCGTRIFIDVLNEPSEVEMVMMALPDETPVTTRPFTAAMDGSEEDTTRSFRL